jgi:hypothetical protein
LQAVIEPGSPSRLHFDAPQWHVPMSMAAVSRIV